MDGSFLVGFSSFNCATMRRQFSRVRMEEIEKFRLLSVALLLVAGTWLFFSPLFLAGLASNRVQISELIPACSPASRSSRPTRFLLPSAALSLQLDDEKESIDRLITETSTRNRGAAFWLTGHQLVQCVTRYAYMYR